MESVESWIAVTAYALLLASFFACDLFGKEKIIRAIKNLLTLLW